MGYVERYCLRNKRCYTGFFPQNLHIYVHPGRGAKVLRMEGLEEGPVLGEGAPFP